MNPSDNFMPRRKNANGQLRYAALFKLVGVTFLVSVGLSIFSALAYPSWNDGGLGSGFRAIANFIPSVSAIAKYSLNPDLAATICSIQWLFAPVYLGLYLFTAPWSSRMRDSVRDKAKQFKFKHKFFFVIGTLYLIAYFLGDMDVLNFPTFFNGKLVSPPDVNILRIIYVNNIALAVYASLAVVAECTLLWFLSVFLLNFKVYLFPFTKANRIKGDGGD